MDVLPRISRQLTELFREMSLLQRVTSIAIPFVVLLAFGWLLFLSPGTDLQAVSFGKSFAPDEMTSAEKAFQSSGLTGYRRDGQKLLVPGKDLDRYNAALLESDAMPADLGSQMLKQYESLGPFSTDRQRQQMKEALLLQELRQMIRAVPDIQDARVVIASSERRVSWNPRPRTTANVMVKPRTGREISATLVTSLRRVVANMVPDLNPADVTIFDVNRGLTYVLDQSEDPADDRYVQHAQSLTRQYEHQIQRALAHIPGTSVTAHVDLDALKSSVVRSETIRSRNDPLQVANRPASIDVATDSTTEHRAADEMRTETTREVTERQVMAAMPKAVQVSVSIPRDYLREVISRRAAKGETSPDRLNIDFIEDDVLSKVEQIVRRLIPAESHRNAVSVTCFDRIESESPGMSKLAARERLSILIFHWGGSVGLGLLALASIWMLRNVSLAKPPTVSEVELTGAVPTPVLVPVPEQSATPTKAMAADRVTEARDEIRRLIESDPTASAAILGRWLADGDDSASPEVRKSAILLLSLEQHLAATLLGKFSREQVERVTLAIAIVENVTRDEQEAVLDEFKLIFASRPLIRPGGPETARELLEQAIEREDVASVQQRIQDQVDAGPFAFLQNHHPDDLKRLIESEHPQTIAVIAAQLPRSLAAQVLAGFTAEDQADILGRLAKLGPMDPEVLVEIALLFKERIGPILARQGGIAQAANVLREADRLTSRSVLQTLDRQDDGLASQFRNSLFPFKSLESLNDDQLKLVLERTNHFQWAVALKGVSRGLNERVFRCLSSQVADGLRHEINSIGPVPLSQITTVQRQIAEAILQFEGDDQFELPRESARIAHLENV